LLSLERYGVLELDKTFKKKTLIQFKVGSSHAMQYSAQIPELNTILQTILRTYGGSPMQVIEINTALVASRAEVSHLQVINCIQSLTKVGVIESKLQRADLAITFLMPRDDKRNINRFKKDFKAHQLTKHKKLKSLIRLFYKRDQCFNQEILAYFEEASEPCGRCDYCRTKLSDQSAINEEHILKALRREQIDIIGLAQVLGVNKAQIKPIVLKLIDDKKIRLNDFKELVICNN
jgi:ATP-dependent DNA helicase RecQ